MRGNLLISIFLYTGPLEENLFKCPEHEIVVFVHVFGRKKLVFEQLTVTKFNVCLANYYANGKESIGLHSDKEELGDTWSIASISLGTTRNFYFQQKGNRSNNQTIALHHGSLLQMGPGTQDNWL